MHGEAFASAKYKRFAAFARSRDDNSLAVLLTKAADECRIENFAKEMEVAGLLSDDLDNLRDVVRDKLYHAERYRQFAQEAKQDGDAGVAELFKQLASDDSNCVHEFEAVLAQGKENKG